MQYPEKFQVSEFLRLKGFIEKAKMLILCKETQTYLMCYGGPILASAVIITVRPLWGVPLFLMIFPSAMLMLIIKMMGLMIRPLQKSTKSSEKQIEPESAEDLQEAASIEEEVKDFEGTINPDPYFNDTRSWNQKRGS